MANQWHFAFLRRFGPIHRCELAWSVIRFGRCNRLHEADRGCIIVTAHFERLPVGKICRCFSGIFPAAGVLRRAGQSCPGFFMTDHDDRHQHYETFTRLFLRNEGKVRGFVRAMMASDVGVDDLVQEVALVAWRKFSDLKEGEEFGLWACVIARYEVLKWRRTHAGNRQDELPQRRRSAAPANLHRPQHRRGLRQRSAVPHAAGLPLAKKQHRRIGLHTRERCKARFPGCLSDEKHLARAKITGRTMNGSCTLTD